MSIFVPPAELWFVAAQPFDPATMDAGLLCGLRTKIPDFDLLNGGRYNLACTPPPNGKAHLRRILCQVVKVVCRVSFPFSPGPPPSLDWFIVCVLFPGSFFSTPWRVFRDLSSSPTQPYGERRRTRESEASFRSVSLSLSAFHWTSVSTTEAGGPWGWID